MRLASCGRALGNLRTEPRPSLSPLTPPSGRSAVLHACQAGQAAAAGQMSRRGQRLVSPERERVHPVTGGWSPWSQAGPRHPGSETGDQGLIITLLHHDTLSRIITQSRSHTQGLCFLDTETPIHFADRGLI